MNNLDKTIAEIRKIAKRLERMDELHTQACDRLAVGNARWKLGEAIKELQQIKLS